MFVASLERVDNAQDFGGVSSSARRVGENSADRLLWVNHKDTADGESYAFLVDVRGVLVVDPRSSFINVWPQSHTHTKTWCNLHVVHERDLALLVAYDWKAQLAPRDLINVFDPAAMALNSVGTQPNELDVSLREFWLEFGKGAELCCADLRNSVNRGVRTEQISNLSLPGCSPLDG